jgi:hypothetical protein
MPHTPEHQQQQQQKKYEAGRSVKEFPPGTGIQYEPPGEQFTSDWPPASFPGLPGIDVQAKTAEAQQAWRERYRSTPIPGGGFVTDLSGLPPEDMESLIHQLGLTGTGYGSGAAGYLRSLMGDPTPREQQIAQRQEAQARFQPRAFTEGQRAAPFGVQTSGMSEAEFNRFMDEQAIRERATRRSQFGPFPSESARAKATDLASRSPETTQDVQASGLNIEALYETAYAGTLSPSDRTALRGRLKELEIRFTDSIKDIKSPDLVTAMRARLSSFESFMQELFDLNSNAQELQRTTQATERGTGREQALQQALGPLLSSIFPNLDPSLLRSVPGDTLATLLPVLFQSLATQQQQRESDVGMSELVGSLFPGMPEQARSAITSNPSLLSVLLQNQQRQTQTQTRLPLTTFVR